MLFLNRSASTHTFGPEDAALVSAARDGDRDAFGQLYDRYAPMVRVSSGWVGFEAEGRESFIPAGALCATRPGVGPGTPYFEDTPDPLKAALVKLDFEQGDPAAQVIALKIILAEARRRDALTLWHLLSRVRETERGPVYDRLTALVPPPKGVTRDGILAGDRHMIERWWDELGLGDTKWWRLWKSPWPPRSR